MDKYVDIAYVILMFLFPFLRIALANSSIKKNEKLLWWEKINNFLPNSVDMVFIAIGFIYAIVKDSSEQFYQILYLVIIVILLVAIINDNNRKHKKNSWIFAVFLLVIIILIPTYILRPKKTDDDNNIKNLPENFVKYLNNNTQNLNYLKEISIGYLSNVGSFDKNSFIKEVEKCKDYEIQNLCFACLSYYEKNYSDTENFLEYVRSIEYQNDKNYILYLINKDNFEKYSMINIKSNTTWLNIDNKNIEIAQADIENYKKYNQKVIILDASEGRRSKSIRNAELLKRYLMSFGYKDIIIERFDYVELGKENEGLKLYNAMHYSMNYQKDGLNELTEKIQKVGIPKFTSESTYLNKTARKGFDLVIVVNELSPRIK